MTFHYLNMDIRLHVYQNRKRFYLCAVPFRLGRKDQRVYRVSSIHYTLQDVIDTPEDVRCSLQST